MSILGKTNTRLHQSEMEEIMKHAKRKSFILVILSVVLCSWLTSTEALATSGSYNASVTDATADFYINDFANLFTEEQKAAMMEKAINLSDNSGGIQVVITTVTSLDDCVTDGSKGHTAAEVAYAMYAQYGIGKDDMGILVLFSVGDREIWVETGRQMQFYITDKKSGELQDDYGIPYFQQGQFAEGLISLQDGIIAEIQRVVPEDWNSPQEPSTVPDKTVPEMVQESMEKRNASEGNYGIVGAFLALVIGLIAAVKSAFSKEKKSQKQIRAIEEKHQKEMEALQEACMKEQAEQQKTWSGIRQRLERDVQKWKDKVAEAENAAQKTQMGLQRTINELKADKTDLTQRLAILQDKFDRAKRLHPEIDFEAEIHQMIEREFEDEAARTDNVLANTLALPADKENESAFLEAIDYYQNIHPEIQKYMKTDFERLQQLYDESKKLREDFERAEQEKRDRAAAQRVYDDLLRVSQQVTVGSHENRQILEDACRKYDRLNSAEQGYFPDPSLIQKLRKLLKVAEVDEQNWKAGQEAEASVQGVVNGVGYQADEDDLDRLTQAMRTYTRLSTAERVYFSVQLHDKLQYLIGQAQDDKEEQERRRRRQREEAARRAASSMSSTRSTSSSSFHTSSSSSTSRRSSGGSSHHGGFGGRPSGGGAGRRF